MTDSVVIAIISTGITFVLGSLTLIWHIYSRASTTQKEDYAKLDEKINSNTTHCVNKQRDLQMNIDQNRDMISQLRAEVLTQIMEHKVDTINRQDASLLIEEKVKPIRDSLNELKDGQNESKRDLKEFMKEMSEKMTSISVQLASMSEYKRRKEDNE